MNVSCRVAFIVYLSDLETATNFSAAPLLPFAELAIDLPASDKLWNATSASDWLQKSLRSPPASGVPFLDAVRALIAPSTPGAFSPDGVVLAKIGTLSAFPLLILSRTLSFLQMKTEEAIRQVDPFRALLGGVGVFDGKEEENHAVLRRIISGREVLKNLPGGIKRGGGEKWFEGVSLCSQTGLSATSDSARRRRSSRLRSPKWPSSDRTTTATRTWTSRPANGPTSRLRCRTSNAPPRASRPRGRTSWSEHRRKDVPL